jgi:hypothetical protein
LAHELWLRSEVVHSTTDCLGHVGVGVLVHVLVDRVEETFHGDILSYVVDFLGQGVVVESC